MSAGALTHELEHAHGGEPRVPIGPRQPRSRPLAAGQDRRGRQRSAAYRLCQAVRDALVLVVSQDGGLRFIGWHDQSVAYWEQVATGPWEA